VGRGFYNQGGENIEELNIDGVLLDAAWDFDVAQTCHGLTWRVSEWNGFQVTEETISHVASSLLDQNGLVMIREHGKGDSVGIDNILATMVDMTDTGVVWDIRTDQILTSRRYHEGEYLTGCMVRRVSFVRGGLPNRLVERCQCNMFCNEECSYYGA